MSGGVGMALVAAVLFFVWTNQAGAFNPLPLDDAPPSCNDIDANGIINEIDCGDEINSQCSACFPPLDNVPPGCTDIDNSGTIDGTDCSNDINNQCSACPPPNNNGLPLDNNGVPGDVNEADWMGIDLSIDDVFNIIVGLACWLLRVAVAVMVIFLAIAGMRFMAARGSQTAYEDAKKNFNHVLIGIIVIMGVFVIIATVANAVGRGDFSWIPLVC